MSKPSIIITTTQAAHNEWMAFASWYSVHRNLPDYTVAVVFPRSDKHYHFTWLNRCHVPYWTYGIESTENQAINMLISGKVISHPVLVLKDHMMVIREPDLSMVEGIMSAEALPGYSTCSVEHGDIVDYSVCGKFVLAEWMEKEKRHPFNRTAHLVPRNRTVNEQRVFQLWRQMEVFDLLNRA